ncbi:MAG: HAMP domain-containing histidine kinase [Xanthomonadales bacterium]|nr:HAMP domain-containing histidine kinase [Xanthomonadales bacterium]
MYLKLGHDKAIPVALRLTLWYAGIFTLSSLIAFTTFYLFIAKTIHAHTDADLIEDIEELGLIFEQGGVNSLYHEFNDDVISVGADKVFFRIIAADSTVLLSTDMSDWPGIPPATDAHSLIPENKSYSLMTLSLYGQPHPARIVTAFINDNTILQFGESLQYNSEFLKLFRTIILITLPLIIVFSCFIGWFMSRKALQGVREVTIAAIDITNGNLHRRVPESGRGDEIDILAKSFNTMLNRIQHLILGMHEMTDNIAHDLRSPLARIRGIAESSLLDKLDMDELKLVSGNTIEECDRLLHMINTMLDITESEAGVVKRGMASINISNLVNEACELFQALAKEKEIQFNWRIVEAATVYGSVQHLQRLIGNLLDNAMKYTNKGGTVSLNLYLKNNDVLIDISDTGIGIAEGDLAQVFKRFYRCGPSQTISGTGLGLSLALAIAHAHQGDISIVSKPQHGTTVTVRIPAFIPPR